MWHLRQQYCHWRKLSVENGKYLWKTAELECFILCYAADSRGESNQKRRSSTISVQLVSRRKRQSGAVLYSLTNALYTVDASVPVSCCAQGVQTYNNTWATCKKSTFCGHHPINLATILFSSACVSSDKNPYTQFYQEGCAKSLIARANRQDMGIGIINCFLIVFAMFAFPLLWFGDEQFSSNEHTVFENKWNGYGNQDSSNNNGMASTSTIRL